MGEGGEIVSLRKFLTSLTQNYNWEGDVSGFSALTALDCSLNNMTVDCYIHRKGRGLIGMDRLFTLASIAVRKQWGLTCVQHQVYATYSGGERASECLRVYSLYYNSAICNCKPNLWSAVNC